MIIVGLGYSWPTCYTGSFMVTILIWQCQLWVYWRCWVKHLNRIVWTIIVVYELPIIKSELYNTGFNIITTQYKDITKAPTDKSSGWSQPCMQGRPDLLLLRWAGLTACLMLLGGKFTLGELTQNTSWPKHWVYVGGQPQHKNNSCADLQMHINVVCAHVWPWVTCLCLSRSVGFTPLPVYS